VLCYIKSPYESKLSYCMVYDVLMVEHVDIHGLDIIEFLKIRVELVLYIFPPYKTYYVKLMYIIF
jgi:hypothetical protein